MANPYPGKKFVQTFDSNGMVNGGRYEDDNGMTLGYQDVSPTAQAAFKPGFYYNNKQVSEDEYRRLTGTASNPVTAPSSVSNAGAAAPYNATSNLAAKREAEADALKGRISGAANPYGVNTEAYQKGLNAAQNSLTYQAFHNQALNAGRIGGASTGMRAAASDAASRDNRAALAGIEAQMYGAERDRAAQYENTRNGALMQLGTGDYSGAAGIYTNLLNSTLGQFNTDRSFGLAQNADARAESSSAIQNEIAKTQLKSYALQFNMDEQTFQQALAAKKAEYEAAAAQGQQAKWEAENAKWLGPLKFAVNVGVGVAKAYAGGGF